MSNALFPIVHGLSWTLTRTPLFKTIIQQAAAPGYEYRLSLGPDVLYKFELNYAVLRKGYSNIDDLSQILAFFEARQGQFDSFLIDAGAITKDAAESSIVNQP